MREPSGGPRPEPRRPRSSGGYDATTAALCRASCASRKAWPAGVSGARRRPATRRGFSRAAVTATVKRFSPAAAWNLKRVMAWAGRTSRSSIWSRLVISEILEEEVRLSARGRVRRDRDAVHPHLGPVVVALLALPEAAALEGDPAEVGASREIDAEGRVAEREAVAEERRGIRHGAREGSHLSQEAEAPLGGVLRRLEDTRGLPHHLLAGAAEVEGEAPRGRELWHLHELQAVDVERALAAVDEGDAGDAGDVEGGLDRAAVGPVLLASPEPAGEVELDHVIAGQRPEAVLVAIVEALVPVLDLEPQAQRGRAGVVHGEPQRAVAGPVGDREIREGSHHPPVDPERSLAVGAPLARDGRLPRARLGPALDGGAVLEVLDDRDRREPRRVGPLAATGERRRGERDDRRHEPHGSTPHGGHATAAPPVGRRSGRD